MLDQGSLQEVSPGAGLGTPALKLLGTPGLMSDIPRKLVM